jgi:hypothetical protein
MDADFLLLRTPEEVEQWERLKDAGEVQDLPQFAPPEAPKKRGFPEYPEGDLIARALRLAFVGGEGEGDIASRFSRPSLTRWASSRI